MLSQWNRSHFPIKQNISPERLLSPKKQNKTIRHLLNLLKAHNIQIPAQFINENYHKYIQTDKQLKLFNKNDDENELKRLRIQINDYKFDLKKMQQDFAEYKVISKIQKQKTLKKLYIEIQNLKKKNQDDNNNWQNRFRERQEIFTKQKQHYERMINQQCQDKINKNFNELKEKYDKKINKLTQELDILQQHIQNKQKLVNQEKVSIIKEFQQIKSKQIQQIKLNSFQRQKEISEKLQKKIEVIEFEKKIQIEKRQQTIYKCEKQKERLTYQIYYLKKDKDELKEEIKIKQRKIIQLQLALRLKDQSLNEIYENFQKQKNQILSQNQHNIHQLCEKHGNQTKQIIKKHLNELDSFYQRIINLQHKKQNAESEYKARITILEEKFQNRVSKLEDLQEIQNLKTKMALKERELFRYQEQLKKSELQRKNNEKNYSRIFSSYSSRRKSSHNTHRDKQAFFKQSNPTDLKLILKICNKQF